MADNALLRSQPPFPEKVGKYELLLPIGTGGMATVYLARSTGAEVTASSYRCSTDSLTRTTPRYF